VDWSALIERSQATLRVCWARLLLGYSPGEIATADGISQVAMADAVAQLREELAS
jgi:hypothetical protein